MLQINTLARLDLGVKQENLARDIYIDMSAWMTDYPNGTVSIWHKRNGDQTKYATSATFDSDTNILTWTPTAYDTFYPGKGAAEIRLTEGGVIKKTKDIITETEKSLMNGSGETIESGWQTFLNTVEGYKNAAGTAKTGAEDAAADAEAWAKGTRDGVDVESTDPAYHNNAAYWADQASEKAGDANTAADAAEDAQLAAETAQGKAEAAEDRAESAVATIDASTEAAEAAATAAVNAKNDAVDAKTDAVSAKNTAVSAKNDAVSAKNDAVSAKNDAVSAKNTAVSAKDDAVSAKTDAVSAKNTAVGAKETAVSAKDDAVAAKEAAEAAIAHYPYVSTSTGTWMIWNPTTGEWVDTEVQAQGETGAVPDISVGTVTTLEPEQSAYVTRRSGSPDEDPVFDFGIPRGQTGSAANVYGSTVDMSPDDSTKVKAAIETRANKVSGGTSGNFAGLDSNGDLVDSGHKHSDYLTAHQDITGKADKVSGGTSGNFAGLDSNGNLTDSGHKHSDYLTAHQDISGKADKVSGGTSGNFAGLDSNGNLTDSGHKHGDYLTAHQDISGKLDKSGGTMTGKLTLQKGLNDVLTGTGTAGQAGSSSDAYIPSLWTFNAGITPADGDRITVKVPVAGVNSGIWMSVDNGGHYYPVAITEKGRLTTQYPAGLVVTLVYQTNMTTSIYGTSTAGAAAGASVADYVSDRWTVLNYYDSGNTDTKVQQNAAITTNGDYPVLLAYSTSTSKVTNAVQKSSSLKYNPNTKALVTGGTVDGKAIGDLAVHSEIAVVVTGNTAPSRISKNQYIYLKDSTITDRPDGLYKSGATINQGDTISAGSLTAVTNISGEVKKNMDNISYLKNDLAIVEDGDTASQNIPAGQAVIWKGTICTASSAISSGDTLSASNLTSVVNGIANGLIDLMYPVGSVYMSFNNTMPAILTAGRTWEAVSSGYVLKTVTSGTGGATSNAGNTGDTTIYFSNGYALVGINSSKQTYAKLTQRTATAMTYQATGSSSGNYTSSPSYFTDLAGSQSHHHTAGMPANIAIYMWKRTA